MGRRGVEAVLAGALLALAAGCHHAALAVGDGSVAVDVEGGAPSADAALAEVSEAAGPCASPLACSEDKAAGPIGTCQVVPLPPAVSPGTPPPWYCDCADGFSVNPKTHLCRAGRACDAAGADEWPNRMALDARDCGTRAPLACVTTSANPEADLRNTLTILAQGTCSLPSYLTVRVEIVDGCARLVEARWFSPSTLPGPAARFLDCFASALAAVRVSCAGAPSCSMFETGGLP